MNFEVRTIVAIGGDCYGVATTIEHAKRNMLRENRNATLRALRFYNCEAKEMTFECGADLMILTPKDTVCMRLEIPQKGKGL